MPVDGGEIRRPGADFGEDQRRGPFGRTQLVGRPVGIEAPFVRERPAVTAPSASSAAST